MPEKNLENKLLIIDLECTCWRGRPPKGMRQEIIEIGVVSLNLDSGEIEDEKGIIVKPTNSKISWFCTELTSIDNNLIRKEGIHFNEACQILIENYNSKNLPWASWDSFDKKHFLKDCKHKKIDYPLSDNHINLQPLFTKFTKEKQHFGVKNALNYLDLDFEGFQHRGVDDAYNTARIAREMLDFVKKHLK